MVIVFTVLTLDIRLQIVGIIKEMFKKEMLMWPHITLNVTNVITMDMQIMIDTSMKENIDIIYNKLWIRK
jgi:hypothetical protein